MANYSLLAGALSLSDNQRRELFALALSELGTLPRGFSTEIDYDSELLRLAEREYQIFFITAKHSTTRCGIFVKPGSEVTNTYCRVVVTTRNGLDVPTSQWGKAMIRCNDEGKIMVLPGW